MEKHRSVEINDIMVFFADKTDDEVRHYCSRIKHGISKQDTWDLASFTVDVMIRGLKQFRKGTVGYPPNLTPKKWKKKIKEFLKLWKDIAYLKEYPIDTEGKWREGIKKLRKSIDKRMPKFWKYFHDLWD